MFRSILDFITTLLGLGRDVVAEADDYRVKAPALRAEAAKALASSKALATRQHEQLAEANRLRVEAEALTVQIQKLSDRVEAMRPAPTSKD
jgi:hypothetical protein